MESEVAKGVRKAESEVAERERKVESEVAKQKRGEKVKSEVAK